MTMADVWAHWIHRLIIGNYLMLTSFSPAQIERFKRDAKALHRSTGISHSAALDQIATTNGYSNWSLLMKHQPEVAKGSTPFKFSRTAEEMRQLMRKHPSLPEGQILHAVAAQQHVADIHERFVSAQYAVDFSIEYVRCLLTVPRFQVHSASRVYLEMRWWLPYHLESIGGGVQALVNRYYKPVGHINKTHLSYIQFPHLHTHLSAEQLIAVAHRPGSNGYLYDDGSTPWGSRKAAEVYLNRLLKLRDALK